MSIRAIEQSKVLRAYCKKLDREGVALRIKELAAKIVEGKDEYQSTLRYAGMIRALAVGCKWDHYWDEKQSDGYEDMYYEANAAIKE